MVHAYTDEGAEAAYKEAVGKDSVSVIFNAKKVQESPASSNFDQILNIYKENSELYLLGEKTIEETMDNFLKQREESVSYTHLDVYKRQHRNPDGR